MAYHPDPKRFNVSRTVLYTDRFMNHFITVGGIGIIIAVLGIFIFIAWQILPLFRSAAVHQLAEHQLTGEVPVVIGSDEYVELPFTVDRRGEVTFFDLAGKRGPVPAQLNLLAKAAETAAATAPVPPGAPEQEAIAAAEKPSVSFTAFTFYPEDDLVVLGTSDGRFNTVQIDYKPTYDAEGKRVMEGTAEAGKFQPIGTPGAPLLAIGYADSGSSQLAAAIQDAGGKRQVHAILLETSVSLFGAGEAKVTGSFDLTAQVQGVPSQILVNRDASNVIVSTEEGTVYFFERAGGELPLVQTFQPFADKPQAKIASMGYLFGDVSLVFVGSGGENRVFSLFVPPGKTRRLWGQTKEFPALPGGAPGYYNASLRNKAFLTGNNRHATVRYSTTESIRWEEDLPFEAVRALISPKYDRLIFLDTANKLHIYELDDHHPNISWNALFGKIWYEGSSEPKYEWQSTGGTDDFEPKLSLVPLIIGTLKGTLYAMVFALPTALLAAIYVSQFSHPSFRQIIKPAMEIMASLPSVVLGFLAALWLAPLAEDRVPSILLMLVFVPLTAAVMGGLWEGAKPRYRNWVQNGNEWWIFLPLMLLVMYVCWIAGPAFESIAFRVPDGQGGYVGDFKRWWPMVTGADYQQRNSLIVGFVMGFAVIPIIFTITEDALSNVPGGLRSASLALGASRWQTALYVVLPTASAGIFSAVMVGLGRAVGETMIVVMATGNTPIMDWNIFSGMRTLSANIAVELPEAPQGDTLYRCLFLGAMLLFLMTFLVNTVAEVLRQHLREKYKVV